ncbi:MAG TPA: multiheme c-type cytochrome [Candidatus Acidoferrum sp.]|nr:multiheme c-type cytochrome [Candidatus Acidoferrum sp.]
MPGNWFHAKSIRRSLAIALCLGSRIFAAAQIAGTAHPSHPAPPSSTYIGNQACAGCHASIYESYQRTPMAHASGPATEDLQPASFVHAKSGVHYRIYSEDGKVWLSFERPGDPSVNGKRELLYFIGSGHRGRTYLFSVDGFFFESPINWYAGRKVWDMAPAYSEAREIPMNLPAYTSCLECHTTGMQSPIKGTENEYPTPLFTQDGVGCERCHGPGAEHAQTAAGTKGAPMLNPIKLPADRRDSICMQCHLEANVAIGRLGRHASDFRPGDILDDYVRHYVLTGSQTSGVGANSQFEALARSACKKKSGDAMSCMSCHDPHSSPLAAERASYFREKCLACHGAAFGAKHHRENLDCTSCHMPSSLSTDIAHTEVTDHRIPRRPSTQPQLLQDFSPEKSSPTLIPFPYSKEADDDVRDRALAWQSVAENGMPEAVREAARLLPLAAKQSPDDPAVLSGLAYVELTHGSIGHARELYQKALALDPTLIDAASNLGVIEAKSGNLRRAIALWQDAFNRAPGKSSIGMNLARSFCESGQTKEARLYVEKVLRFNPDLLEAKKMLQHLSVDPPSCAP